MSYRWSQMQTAFRQAEAAFRTQNAVPWLLWNDAPADGTRHDGPTQRASWEELVARAAAQKALKGEPLAIPIRKGGGTAFVFGVTLGHTENNDIVVAAPTVSRFHAWFQARGSRFELLDAGSTNGTTVDGVRLEARKPFLLDRPSHALTFGDTRLEWLSAESLFERLRSSFR